MRRRGRRQSRCSWILLPGLLIGCSTVPSPLPVRPPAGACLTPETATIRQAVFRPEEKPERAGSPAEQPADPSAPALHAPAPLADPGPLAGLEELSVDGLVRAVLAVNPTLAQMMAAWKAARARYPQVTSLADPTFTLTLGPETYFSDRVNPAYRVNLSQTYPWPGKLELRGKQATAEARAAGNEVDDTRLQLVESTRIAFYDYYLVHRAIAVNDEGIRLLESFKKDARFRYENGIGVQQDILQADVELGRQRERALLLEQARQIAVARINTLLNLSPDTPLPPPPREVPVEDGLPPPDSVRAAALSTRPDLKALANRIDADQAALALANKEFYPDFTPFAMYDRFMGNNHQSQPLALMVGFGMNLPVRLRRRYAAVAEAQARINERRAELQERVNRINFEVQRAYAQVEQGGKAVRLYEKTVVPAARLNVKSAQSAYVTGKIPFLTLIEAERDVIGLLDRYYELVATYYRRLATLERVAGGSLVPGPPAGTAGNACSPAGVR
jgi:cobalt-zinc-cadmium efflux system outer membrane protein